jgi:hypothetical protein
VIVDEVGEPDEDGDVGATGRSQADAPEMLQARFRRTLPVIHTTRSCEADEDGDVGATGR